jgi:hypothetical protein
VRQIRGLWYKCAQSSGNVETAAKLLLEMMSPSEPNLALDIQKLIGRKWSGGRRAGGVARRFLVFIEDYSTFFK